MNLKGKNVFFLGSSVTYGYASDGVSFADLMAEQLDFHMIKEAVSGTTLADRDETSYVSRLKKWDASTPVDVFVCQLSTNDAKDSLEIPLHEISNAIESIVRYVKSTWDCPIVFYTGTKYDNVKYLTMIDLLKAMRKAYGFAILDLWHDIDMLCVDKEDYNRYMQDPIHPRLAGYRDWWLPKFIDFFEKL